MRKISNRQAPAHWKTNSASPVRKHLPQLCRSAQRAGLPNFRHRLFGAASTHHISRRFIATSIRMFSIGQENLRRIEKGETPASTLQGSIESCLRPIKPRESVKGSLMPTNGHSALRHISKNFVLSIRFSQATILPSRNSPPNSPARIICNLSGRRYQQP